MSSDAVGVEMNVNANETDLGVDITPNKCGAVLKKILREGTGEDGPLTGDSVTVHYVGTLADNGEKFDSSRDRNSPFKFTIGKGQVIKAWDCGVATMKRGELAVLTCRADYAYGETGSPPKIPPNATLVFEVELLDWMGEDITTEKDGGVLRSKIKAGEYYDSPKDGAQCTIHVQGRFEGRVFEDRDVTFTYGEGLEAGVVDGVEKAVGSMLQNEQDKIVVKAAYAYGSEGNADYQIPPGATLEYIVTLKSFEKKKERWEMDATERMEQAEIFKTKGNNYFKNNKLDLASKFYDKAVDLLKHEQEEVKEEKTQYNALLATSRLNAAMCCIKLNEFIKARDFCDSVLEDDPNNEKALFRRATAKMNLQSYEEAIEDFKKVLDVAPDNKAAKNQITLAQHKIKEAYQKEKKMYAGMFKKFAEVDSKKEQKPDNSDVFGKIGDWDNKMADGYLPLDKEAEAFGEKIAEPKYNKTNGTTNNVVDDEDSGDD